ncbi:MAG: transcriptional regulator, partial [Gemmatimonadales bacterium]
MTDTHLGRTPGMTRIGPYSVDRAALEISRDGARIDLSPQAVRVLLILADRAGELVTRQELYESLWPEADVDMDRGLNTLIRSIRHALGVDSTRPTWIRT